jgi:hypothetical protein
MNRKIVINRCHGGFGLSKEASEMYCAVRGIDPGQWNSEFDYYEGLAFVVVSRDDPDLVKVVEALGAKANGLFAKLKVVEIPADVEWEIKEYDGVEWVAEKHRTWS